MKSQMEKVGSNFNDQVPPAALLEDKDLGTDSQEPQEQDTADNS